MQALLRDRNNALTNLGQIFRLVCSLWCRVAHDEAVETRKRNVLVPARAALADYEQKNSGITVLNGLQSMSKVNSLHGEAGVLSGRVGKGRSKPYLHRSVLEACHN